MICNVSVAGKKDFFRCDIDKQTPLEGGMGGGSSNCATAMWAGAHPFTASKLHTCLSERQSIQD